MINEMCTICGGYIGPAIILSSSSNPPVRRCLGHIANTSNLFPDIEGLWEVVRVVAETESTYYSDNDGRVYCPFCSAQKELPPYDVTHTPDCIVTKARTLVNQRELQPRVEFKFHTEAEDAMIVTRVVRRKELMSGKWDKEVIDVTCEQCGERYHGPLEDMRGWYEFVEQEPHRNRYAFCSEAHMKQWKVDRGVQW